MHEQTSVATGADFSRRGFVATTLAAGFALAVQPVSAETITTDTQGPGSGRGQDPRRPTARFRRIARCRRRAVRSPWFWSFRRSSAFTSTSRTSADGSPSSATSPIAPELYARQGDVSKITDFKEIIGKVVSKVPDAQVMSDLDATVA